VKTRTLLLLSLACAIAITGAGIGLLLQLRSEPDVSPVAQLGEVVNVGDLSVALIAAEHRDDETVVTLDLGGISDPVVTDVLTLVAAGETYPVTGGDCDPVAIAPRRCEVTFDRIESDSHVFVVRRGEQVRRWVLPTG
jgi:hypothetical protein